MVRRSLGAFLWMLAGILACFLGGLSALVGTDAGRELLRREVQAALGGVLAGRVEIGGAGGTLLTSLSLADVRLYDLDTTLVAWLPRAQVEYSLLDFAAGRVVIQGVQLDHPYVNIVQHQSGRLNLEELLRLGEPSPPRRGPKPLVVLRDVDIVDGNVVLRLQAAPSPADSGYEIDEFGTDGRHRIRRFERLTAHLNAFRISAPGQQGLLVSLGGLAVQGSDPHVQVTDARGRITIDGDSLDADLATVRLPASRFTLRGRLAWPRDTLLYDLTIDAAPVTLADARFIDPRFPDGAVLQGKLAVRSHGGRLLELRVDPLDVAYHGGRARGRATAFIAADSGLVALRATDITTSDLDLAFPRAFLDTLPFYGHLSGRVRADGPLDALTLETDWSFRDSLVPGSPVSRVRGGGLMNLSAPAGITFTSFTMEDARLAFGTIREFVPAATLRGTLDAAGTLNGSLTDVRFNGLLRHRDGSRPASVLRGAFVADARRDTLALDVDARVDTLSFDGLHPSLPGLGLTGSVTGTVRLAGRLDSLVTTVDLARLSGRGRVHATGALVLLPDRTGTRNLQLDVHDVSLARWLPGGPPSRVNLTATATFDADTTGAPPVGAVSIRLAPSRLAGTALDSGAVRLAVRDGLVTVDTLWLRQPGLITEGAGTLGWRRPMSGEAFVNLDADSLGSLDSLVAWIAGSWSDSVRAVLTQGAGHVHLRIAGALDSLALGGLGDIQHLALGEWDVPNAHLKGGYEPGAVPLFWIEASTDSIAHAQLGFGAASASIRGRADSLDWFARSRIGELSGFVAGGRYARDTSGLQRAEIDSLAVLLPGGVWFLESPTSLAVDDSAFTVGRLALRRVNGPGHLELRGTLPTRGAGSAQLAVQDFPLAGVYALLQRDTLGVAGGIQADLTLAGTRRAPVYQGRFSVVPDSAGAPSLDGSLSYADRRLFSAAHLRLRGREIVALTAYLPLDLALTDVAQRQLPDTLAIRAHAEQADLSALEAFTTLLRNVHGRVSADVGIRGTWKTPRLDGALQVDSGGMAIPALNVRWEDVAGHFRLGGDTLTVDSLIIHSDHGRAELTGYVRMEELTRPVLALDLQARDFQALEIRGDLSVTATAQLALRGPLIGATLTGAGTVTTGVLYFADLVEKRIIDLDAPDPMLAALIDTSLAAVIRRQGLGPAFNSVFLDNLKIRDLQLSMGSSVWLRSTEANIQLAGRVAVNKEGRTYRLTGTLLAPRGTYRLQVGPVSREFVVTQGTVRYFGTPDLDAALDIDAQHVVHPVPTPGAGSNEDVVVVAHIGGTLLVPQLTLRAQGRDLPQTDLISYLLFGQPSADVSGGGGAAASRRALLLSTAASIAAGELERTVVSDLGIPLDYVEIRPGDPGNPIYGATVAAGWQLGEKTFFIVRASFCPGAVANILGASLQFRISPEWRTEASVEPVNTRCIPGGGSSSNPLKQQVGADLFWERRY
jgi:translocation and assembly module TamB